MAKKRKRNKILKFMTGEFPNLPTHERMFKGNVSIRNNIGIVDEPLRIDKLLRNGIIDEMQHLYGMQIITYWMIANRPFIRTSSYEQRIGKIMPNFEYLNISRMGAEDKFYKTMEFLGERDRVLICKICLEEMGAIEVGRKLGLPVNSITVYVRAAFDALGNALVKMRKYKSHVEKSRQETD